MLFGRPWKAHPGPSHKVPAIRSHSLARSFFLAGPAGWGRPCPHPTPTPPQKSLSHFSGWILNVFWISPLYDHFKSPIHRVPQCWAIQWNETRNAIKNLKYNEIRWDTMKTMKTLEQAPNTMNHNEIPYKKLWNTMRYTMKCKMQFTMKYSRIRWNTRNQSREKEKGRNRKKGQKKEKRR